MGSNSILRLSKKYSNYLENQPEQGMGYQLVDIKLKNGLKLNERVVLNSIFLKLNEGEKFDNDDIKELRIRLK